MVGRVFFGGIDDAGRQYRAGIRAWALAIRFRVEVYGTPTLTDTGFYSIWVGFNCSSARYTSAWGVSELSPQQ